MRETLLLFLACHLVACHKFQGEASGLYAKVSVIALLDVSYSFPYSWHTFMMHMKL